MKQVLVTTDFSELADEAIAPAAEIARGTGAELTLAHVLGTERPPKPQADAAYYKVAQRLYEADQELEAQARASLEERARTLSGVRCNVALARGEPVAGILQIAKQQQTEMIVISSQGRTGLRRFLLGSVAEELARLSPVPVLIWKHAEEADASG